MSGYSGGFNDVDPTQYPGLVYVEAQATSDTTTSSSTYSLLSGMTLTPLAGTYIAIFSCSSSASVLLGAPTVNFALFINGTKVERAERSSSSGRNSDFGTPTFNTLITVNGTDVVEVRWNTSSGTANCLECTLTLLKVANL